MVVCLFVVKEWVHMLLFVDDVERVLQGREASAIQMQACAQARL
jgi:hypothetical protein